MHHAIERMNVEMAKALIAYKPDLEIASKVIIFTFKKVICRGKIPVRFHYYIFKLIKKRTVIRHCYWQRRRKVRRLFMNCSIREVKCLPQIRCLNFTIYLTLYCVSCIPEISFFWGGGRTKYIKAQY